MSLDRRNFLLLIAWTACVTAASAKDGDSGDNSGPGSGDDGGDDSGDGDNSGPGNANDDGDDTDDDGDDESIDQDEVLNAVRGGEIIPLKKALDIVKRRNPGKIIDVSLKRRTFSDVYSFKVKSPSGRVVTMQMNARTGVLLGF